MSDRIAVIKLLEGAGAWNDYMAGNPATEYDFKNAELSELQSLAGYHFDGKANFSGAKFLKLDTGQAEFKSGAHFDRISISGSAIINTAGAGTVSFREARFEGPVSITSVFNVTLDFTRASFSQLVQLTHSFSGELNFDKTDIQRGLIARDVAFFRNVYFRKAYIGRTGEPFDFDMRNCKFKGAANFSGLNATGVFRIAGCEFGARTYLRNATFYLAPAFHGTTLHAETIFNVPEKFDRQFMDVTSDRAEARYRTLKLLMSDHHAIAEQLAFGRLELKSRARQLGPAWWLSVFGCYELFADNGMSWLRPLFWLIAGVGVGWMTLWNLALPGTDWKNSELMAMALGNAVPYVTTLKVFGPSKIADLFDVSVLPWVEMASIGSGLFSTIMLFLIALGIRNRLRLK